MVQNRTRPRDQFLGPFLGLNTTLDPSQLSQAQATRCENVILSDRRIRVREPWRSWGASLINNNHDIVSMFHFVSPHEITGIEQSYAIVQTLSGIVSKLWKAENGLAPVFLTDKIGPQPASFEMFNGQLYVFAGPKNTGFNIVTDGTPEGTHYMGMRKAVRSVISAGPGDFFESLVSVSPGIGATVKYAVTVLDSIRGREGNPFITAEYSPTTAQGVRFTLNPSPGGFVPDPLWQFDKIRIYRKNITESQTGYRLIKEFDYPALTEQVTYTDQETEAQLEAGTVSNLTDGPFAPSRNEFNLNGRATMGVMFKQRMWINDQDNDRLVRFSGRGTPEAIDPDDFYPLDGDQDERIHGMKVLGDQLVVGKRRAMWAISGSTETPTNLSIATGATSLDDQTEVRKIPSNMGPSVPNSNNTHNLGNGFVVAGEPAGLYFPNDAGFFRYDGLDARILTDDIKPTWQKFRLPRKLADSHFSYADDVYNGVLYIANTESDFMLAYHYKLAAGSGAGAWSVITAGGQVSQAKDVVVSAIASYSDVGSGGSTTVPKNYVPFLVGSTVGHILESDPDDPTAYVPEFFWESGLLPAIRGYRAHVYYAKFFLSSKFVTTGPAPQMQFEILADGDDARKDLRLVDITNRDFIITAIRRTMSRIQIIIKRGALWTSGYNVANGVLGWEFDTELVGQR